MGGDDGHARQFLTLVDPRTGVVGTGCIAAPFTRMLCRVAVACSLPARTLVNAAPPPSPLRRRRPACVLPAGGRMLAGTELVQAAVQQLAGWGQCGGRCVMQCCIVGRAAGPQHAQHPRHRPSGCAGWRGVGGRGPAAVQAARRRRHVRRRQRAHSCHRVAAVKPGPLPHACCSQMAGCTWGRRWTRCCC